MAEQYFFVKAILMYIGAGLCELAKRVRRERSCIHQKKYT